MARVALVVLAAVWACLPSVVLAQEARYNFASAQGEKRVVVTPGGQASGLIYFYNAEGNRITHVNLAVIDAPAGLQVTIDPPAREMEVDLGGSRVVVTENLYVEPTAFLSEPARDVPEGSVCIGLGEKRFTVAKVARVVIQASEGASLGSTGRIRIAAEAFWLGQTGAAAMKQARDFEFNVEVTAPSVAAERVIGEAPIKPSEQPQDSIALLTRLLGDYLPAFAAGALALLGMMRIGGRVSGKKGGKD